MNKLTYQEAYDLIIDAYFKDEIKPQEPSFCFCGTLNNNIGNYWAGYRMKLDGLFYNANELQRMEEALFDGIQKHYSYCVRSSEILDNEPFYEEALFDGMYSALRVLKKIHRSRGEDVDSIQSPFTKRVLKEKV